ncbi:MAG: arginine--tRNA ligase [Phycisphaerae bacterium]
MWHLFSGAGDGEAFGVGRMAISTDPRALSVHEKRPPLRFDAKPVSRFTTAMQSILAQLRTHFDAALRSVTGEPGVDVRLRAAADPKFGDYQCSAAMGLAKKLGQKPRYIAQQIVAAMGDSAADMLEPPEIAGPGFINLRLKAAYLEQTLGSIPRHAEGQDRLGIDKVPAAERDVVVIDYSSPNVAKEMHVGHLRTTIIGDTIARTLAFQGHRVIRQNHLGDWGTQFGMIILALWHICMAAQQSESVNDFDRIAGELTDPDTDAARRAALLEQRRAIHQANLDRDPDGRTFHAFIRTFKPSFDVLLPAYRYVNVLEASAQGTDLAITDPGTGQRVPLGSVSRRVAAILQGKTGTDNEQELDAWKKARDATLKECDTIYRRMGILLDDADICGESFYEPLLPGIVEELQARLTDSGAGDADTRAICRNDAGAVCVFLENADGSPAFTGPKGAPLPMIIRKSDGASLYATTDLAAILYRLAHPEHHPIRLCRDRLRQALARLGGGLGADRILYVVGAPQKLHFQMLFSTVHALGWTQTGNRRAQLEHISFGSVLGEDRKMLKTRSGENVKLKDLLNEAVTRAEALVRDTEADPRKRRGFDEAEIRHIAETVGIAAVKYADYCQNRNTDYVFSWDKMLAMQGNTAPYMLYAYARIRSIYRRGANSRPAESEMSDPRSPITLTHPAERALALGILRCSETLDAVAATLLPNVLCEYLYDLAGKFMAFYEGCPVLQAPDDATRVSRLRLCHLTARTLRLGLNLLGISTLERM